MVTGVARVEEGTLIAVRTELCACVGWFGLEEAVEVSLREASSTRIVGDG